MTSRAGAQAYTIGASAPRAAIDAAHRGALLALRDRLELVSLEIGSEGPWPPDVAEAVAALLPRRRRLSLIRRRAEPVYTDVAADSEEFTVAVTLAPYADYVVGKTYEGPIAYDTVDQGSAPRFELTPTEVRSTREYMATQGHSPALLVADERPDTHG